MIFLTFTQKLQQRIMKIHLKHNKLNILRIAFLLACFAFASINVQGQTAAQNDAATKEITGAMDNSALEWNKGHLDAFMTMYDPSATMMMPTGTVGLDAIRSLYEKKYFNGAMPKQNLRYSDMKVRFLGNDYVLLTGAFTLYGNNLPERSGRYSLLMVHTGNGWKILHDHSS
jgi:ketosteroid isomerase-like protein